MGCGIILYCVGLYLIAWNEYRTVQTEKAIALGEDAMVEGDCGSVGAVGSLVLVKCDLTRTQSEPFTMPYPSELTDPFVTFRSALPVEAPAGESAGVSFASSESYSEMGLPDGVVPLVISARAEVLGWVEKEHCTSSRNSGSRNTGQGSTTQSSQQRTCTYHMELQWTACSNVKSSGCQVKSSGWRNRNPTIQDRSQMDANARANLYGTYLPGSNPLASQPTVYVQDAFLGTAYPLNEETINMITSRGVGESQGSGIGKAMPTSCAPTTPWSSATSYYANCEYEKLITSSQACTTLENQPLTTCNPANPPAPAPPALGRCTTSPLPQCNQINTISTADMLQASCVAQVGCIYVPPDTGGVARCETAQNPACGTTAATALECSGRGQCIFSPPSGGAAGTCFMAPVASINGEQCCLDGSSCGDYGSSVGQRRISFSTTYGSDATIAAQQEADGTFTKWVPEGVDEFFSPWDYGSFGKKDKETILKELYDDNDLWKVVLRVVGWLLTWWGLQMVTGPLTVLPDLIPVIGPCIGDLLGAALCCVNLMVSLGSSLFVGAIAWILVRPVLSLSLLFVCVLLAAGTYYTRQNHGSLEGEKAAASKTLPIAQTVAVPAAEPGMEVDVMVPEGCVPNRRLSS